MHALRRRGFIVPLLAVTSLLLGGCQDIVVTDGTTSHQPGSPGVIPPDPPPPPVAPPPPDPPPPEVCTQEDLPPPPLEVPDNDPGPLALAPDIVIGTSQLTAIAGAEETTRVRFFQAGAPIAATEDSFSVASLDEQIVSASKWSRDGQHYMRLNAVAPGTATVRVTRGDATADMTVTVLDSVVAKMSLADTQATVKRGRVRDIGAFFYHATGAWIDNATFSATSSDPNVLTSAPGLSPSKRTVVHLMGAEPGTANVTVSANGKSESIGVTVLPNPVQWISFWWSDPTIASQCAPVLPLNLLDAESYALRLSASKVTITTSDPQIVNPAPQTDAYGNLSGLILNAGDPGTASVTVSVDGVQAVLTVTVTAAGGDCYMGEEEEEEEEEEEDPTVDGGMDPYFYFSYDDSASTAAVEVVKHMLKRGEVPPKQYARVWEFLNYERFAPACPTDLGLFDVSMGMVTEPVPAAGGQESKLKYKLGAYVASPTFTNDSRPNLVLTVLVDISGSMSTELPVTQGEQAMTRIELVKYGLQKMLGSLRQGDVVNLVTFDTEAQIEMEGAVAKPGQPSFPDVQWAVHDLYDYGSTNLDAGIGLAYRVARRHYDAGKMNRVIILTDAFANTGEVDPNVIAENVVISDKEGIYFSGLGVSEQFDDAFLNVLTDVGKGGYFSLVTATDARRAFTERFIGLVSVAARDVRFRLDYPGEMKHIVTASEQSSQNPDDVQPTNFSYNTDQYFFEVFSAPASQDLSGEKFKLTAYYTDPTTGAQHTEVIERSVGEMLGRHQNNLVAAELIYLLNQLVGQKMTATQVKAAVDALPDLPAPVVQEYKALIDEYAALVP